MTLTNCLLFLTIILTFQSICGFITQNKITTTITNRYVHTNDDDSNTVKTSEILSLDSIRSTLVRQEETIIFALIERAQFRRNHAIYDMKQNKLRNVYGAPLSFLEWMLIETEKLHAKVRRYTSPEEHAFYPNLLPSPILPVLDYPQLLKVVDKNAVNVNSEVLRWYQEKIIDRLCVSGDDEQHGSSVLCDIAALQALSKRVHYGKFVAESKYIQNPNAYNELIKNNDVQGVLNLLTNVEVERNVIRRAFVKASTYGQDISSTNLTQTLCITPGSTYTPTPPTPQLPPAVVANSNGYKIEPKLIADIYCDMVIPLTKDVEVRYLFHRVGLPPPPPDEYYHLCRGPLDAFKGLD